MSEIFEATARRLEEWKANPDILGVLLVGSKSRGHNDGLSDDDLEVLFTDEAYQKFTPLEVSERLMADDALPRLIYDTQYLPLSDLARKAHSPFDLDRWPYERAVVLFDRDGHSVADAVKAVGVMSADFRQKRLLHATIDAWIVPGRAAKTIQRGNLAAARLITARGAKALCRLVFALEGRWVPLDHWLENELRTLADSYNVAPLIVELLNTGDPALVRTALERLESRLTEEGIPAGLAERRDLFFELVHPARAVERGIHGLY
jgi:hypothetical protein